ncbi:hypothetical protein A4A49_09642 [Nicotiana attenuata]|uniref:Uncharacterized protein n=1 Tax=Nicotiana attenuata TaxID=49451 RepID=A0A314KWH1_NICAT|nr:hypothetical protein A4A49_09642 [Nicotiana attenuata]
MELKKQLLKQRKGSKRKKQQAESSSSLWMVTAYSSISYILRKAKAIYEWFCDGNQELWLQNEVTVVDPYFSLPVLPAGY